MPRLPTIIVFLIYCTTITLADTSKQEPTPWSSDAVRECQEERRTYSSKWGASATYRPADEITPAIWLGNICAAMDQKFLDEHNIGLVVGMAREWPFEGISPSGVRYVHIPLDDSSDEEHGAVMESLESAYRHISEHIRAQESEHGDAALYRRVLVYCNMGISRSTTAVLYTVVKMTNDAFKFVSTDGASVYDIWWNMVRNARPIARPNSQYRDILTSSLLHHPAIKTKEEL